LTQRWVVYLRRASPANICYVMPVINIIISTDKKALK
jgi:hypothetical protein